MIVLGEMLYELMLAPPRPRVTGTITEETMKRSLKLWPLAALLITGVTHAATKEDSTIYFCARAALFAESFAEESDASKSQHDSIVGAVAKLNSTFKGKVDDGELRLLLPWAAMVDKLPGYKPHTKGSYVAVACMAALRDAVYVPFQKPDVPAKVQSLLATCGANEANEEVGKCIQKGFTSLPLEKLDK